MHPDVSQVSEEEIKNWKPSQVAHWLHIARFNDAVVERFLINDITGAVLLSLESDDLKELDIHSFGIRHNIMSSIKHLKDTMLKGPPLTANSQKSQTTSSTGRSSPERRSYTMSVSPAGEVLSNHTFGKQMGSQITPAESVSIVGIEQVLPRPHKCSKGENCATYKKRQRQIAQIKADFPDSIIQNGAIITGNPGNPETARNMLLQRISNSEPSVVASSDVFGPSTGPRLSEAALQDVQKMDRQKAIEDFLKNQHVEDAYPKPAPPRLNTTDLSPQKHVKANMAAKLAMLPGLNIPDSTSPNTEDMTTAVTTPTRGSQVYGSPTAIQQYGPFTQLGSMHSGDYLQKYRAGTPASEMDVPITAIPNDGPISRDTSQSVPPDMQYGSLFPPSRDPMFRSATARPRAPQVLRQVHENRALTPIENPADLVRSPRMQQHAYTSSQSSQSSLASDPDVTHAGYMKKRKTTKLVAHHWDKKHFTLRGTSLDMHDTEEAARRRSRALESIDVDDYAVACSSVASSSKLTAAFKRSILRGGKNLNSRDNSAFAFSLIPATKENERKALLGSGGKSHHFAVDTREARIDWMRELMLARALKKGKDSGEEIRVNGTLI